MPPAREAAQPFRSCPRGGSGAAASQRGGRQPPEGGRGGAAAVVGVGDPGPGLVVGRNPSAREATSEGATRGPSESTA